MNMVNRYALFALAAAALILSLLVFLVQSAHADASDLMISEIMYNPASLPDNDWEYVEIYNGGATTVDLAGFVLDDDDGTPLVASNVTGTIAAGETAVLYNSVLSETAFINAWGAGINLIAVSNWPFLASNDRVGVWASLGDYGSRDFTMAVDDVAYFDVSPWPVDDGQASIYLISVNADNDIASYWKLSKTGIDGAYTSQPAGQTARTNVGSPGVVPATTDVPPAVKSTTPSHMETNVSVSTDIEIIFTENVTLTGAFYTISDSLGAAVTATFSVTENVTSVTLDPENVLGFNETYTVTIYQAGVTDGSGLPLISQYVFTFTTSGPPADCAATMVINEIDPNTPGVDTVEFIELYDTNGGNTPLDGCVVVLFNGDGDVSYRAFDLDGFSTNSSGLFLMGNNGVVPKPSLIFANETIQNGADAVALYSASAIDFPNGTAVTQVDLLSAIVYGAGEAPDTGLLDGLGETTQINENANMRVTKDSIQRENVSRDPGIAYGVDTPTPGALNGPVPTAVQLAALTSGVAQYGLLLIAALLTLATAALIGRRRYR